MKKELTDWMEIITICSISHLIELEYALKRRSLALFRNAPKKMDVCTDIDSH